LITNDTTGTTIALYLTELSQIKIEIADSTKTIIRTIIPSVYLEPGQALINWDGKDKTGNFVTSGQYTIHTYLYPTYSAPKSYFKKELETKVRKT
jgi:flagellar hook assembly protein FlgD